MGKKKRHGRMIPELFSLGGRAAAAKRVACHAPGAARRGGITTATKIATCSVSGYISTQGAINRRHEENCSHNKRRRKTYKQEHDGCELGMI